MTRLAFLFAGFIFLSSFTNTCEVGPGKTILFIPYQPMMHLSDADADIAKHSGIKVPQARVQMRDALKERLMLRMQENFSVKELAETGTYTEENNLNDFYDLEGFYLSSLDTDKKNSATILADAENPYFGIFKGKTSPDYASSYMNVALRKPALFQKLASEYEAEYFVVLTQFEIKTYYGECINIANRVFRREFLVHFAVFNAQGEQTGGTAVSYEAGSDVNTVNKISADVFPGLAEKVCAYLSNETR